MTRLRARGGEGNADYVINRNFIYELYGISGVSSNLREAGKETGINKIVRPSN